MVGSYGLTAFFDMMVGVQNDEALVALTKKLRKLAESEKAVSRNSQELTSKLNSQSAAAKRAAGQMRFLNETSRSYTAQTQGLQERASEIGNITGELNTLQQSQQKIQNFEELLGQTDLTMSVQGDIIRDSSEGLRDALAGEGPGRREVIDQLQQGREKLQGRQNLRDKIGSMQPPQMDQFIQGTKSQMERTFATTTSEVQKGKKELRSKLENMQAPQMDQLLQNAKPRLESTMVTANAAAEGMAELGGRTKDTNQLFGKMFGVGMNLMFMGMALQKTFGGLAGSMLKTVGVTQTFGAAAKSTLLPFFMAIAPLLNKIAFFFMNLSRPIKIVMGAFVALMAVMATFLFFGAQVGIMAATISGSFAALSASILVIVAGLGIISVAIAGLVLLFDEGSKALGALMVALSAAAGLMYAFGLRTAFAKGMLGPLNAALSTVLGFFGSIGTSAGFLKNGLTFLSSTFVKFASKLASVVAPILSSVAAIFKTFLVAIAPVLIVVAGLAAGFLLVNKILEQFSGVIKTVVGIAIAVVAGLIAVFVGGPLAIAAAVGAIIAVIWEFKDEIIDGLKAVIKFVGDFIGSIIGFFAKLGSKVAIKTGKFIENVVGFFKVLPRKASEGISNFVDNALESFRDLYQKGTGFVGDLIDFVTSMPKKIANKISGLADATMELGKDLVEGFVDGIEAIGDDIADTFFDFLPGPLATAIKGISKFSGDLISNITDVLTPNDFILTSGGKMIEPAANDTIVGFNGKGPIQPGGGGGGEVTVNINDAVMKEDVDVQRVVDEVENRVNRDARGRTGGL